MNIRALLGRQQLRSTITFSQTQLFVRRSTVIPIGELTSAQTQAVVIDMCQTVYHDDIQDVDLEQLAKDIVSISERNKRSGDHQPDAALTLLDTVMSAHAYDRLSNDAVKPLKRLYRTHSSKE